jgi:hypothetical protein
MIPCPCCRAANESGPNCRRCKADLSLLFAVARRRAFLLSAAQAFAAEGRLPAARRALDEATALRAGDDVRRLRAAVDLLAGDYRAAWNAYDAVVAGTES